VDFNHVALSTNLQRTPVNMVTNLRFSQRGLNTNRDQFIAYGVVTVLSFYKMFDYATTWLFMIHTLTQSEDLLRQKTECISNHMILNSLHN
jgi:hypothetical protein